MWSYWRFAFLRVLELATLPGGSFMASFSFSSSLARNSSCGISLNDIEPSELELEERRCI